MMGDEYLGSQERIARSIAAKMAQHHQPVDANGYPVDPTRPRPLYQYDDKGILARTLWVDQNGQVVSATPNTEGAG